MIVKNESSNIERCLSSVAAYIDYYVICDTGSTDDTKEKIVNFFDLKGIKGEIHDHKWEDFGTNRTKALELTYGKTKWALMIDADDSISGKLPVEKLSDEFDAYNVILSKESFRWYRTQIFNISKKEWKYVEPLHEYPTCEGQAKIGTLEGKYSWDARAEGCRAKESATAQEKYTQDYWTLKSYLKKDPKQPRKQFYAAQSAFDGGMFKVAEEEYIKRINLGDWIEEVFYSWFRIGACRERLGRPLEQIIDAYMMAYETCPHRVESLVNISRCYREHNRPRSAYLAAIQGANIPYPKDLLFIEASDYLWRIHDEIGATAYYMGEWVIGARVCEKLLRDNFFPPGEKERINGNYNLYKEALKEQNKLANR
jgi:glycosyltransferase involved in cell wall biosynthesis